MSVQSGNFPRVERDLPRPALWLRAGVSALLDALTLPVASAARWLEARDRRRAARLAARAEDLRLDWWRAR